MNDTAVDVFRGHGIKIDLAEPDDFLVVKESLTRIGIAGRVEGKKKLVQSSFILHKRGQYAIVHFKELFLLDGKKSDITRDDYARRDRIANLLQEWGLCHINDPREQEYETLTKQESQSLYATIKIVPFKEKKDWILTSKYHIGN